jgi:UDP-N-acetylmuramate dehydrogenase
MGMLLEENKVLAPFTTFGIGGPARWFAEGACEDDIAEAAAWAAERGVPLFVLGGGSNLLIADAGFQGLVLHVRLKGIERRPEAGSVLYQAGGGEDWDGFVQRCVADDCAGLECLAGIPGTVGGTPVQNVGAYGQEVASCIERVRVFDLRAGNLAEFTAIECGFAYRRSRFNTEDRGCYVVTRVDYRLTPEGAPTLLYADLQQEFAGRANPSLAEVTDAVRRIRRSKGMLLIDGDEDCRSAGSFFKNPVVGLEQLNLVSSAVGKEAPHFPAGPRGDGSDHVKLSAAWLIEQAGFKRGFSIGAAGISSRHTLALINRGGATAAEILALADKVAATVESMFGVRLEKEPVLLGFGPGSESQRGSSGS